MPFEILYNISELNIIKKPDLALIIVLSILGIIIFLVLIFFIFRKKKICLCKRKKLRLYHNINDLNINNSVLENLSEANKEDWKFPDALINMINQKKSYKYNLYNF